MDKEEKVYVPKGGMCNNCEKRFNDCSDLPFHTMPVISNPEEGLYFVRCVEHFKDIHFKDINGSLNVNKTNS